MDDRPEIAAKGSAVKRNRSGRITRTKILDSAEQIFAEKGVHGASLREIMIVAEVNIAAVNYYFGSKADLLRAVVQRRSTLINGARMSLLEDGRRKSGTSTIDDWLHAFVAPFVDAEGSSDAGWRNFMRVLNWVATGQGQDKLCQEIIQDTYGAMRQSFLNALAEALPELTTEEINWRYYSAVTVLRTVVVARERAELAGAPMPNASDLHHMMAHIVPFLRGGLTAPAMSATKNEG
jgi:AcrR family transcriptional regulator